MVALAAAAGDQVVLTRRYLAREHAPMSYQDLGQIFATTGKARDVHAAGQPDREWRWAEELG
jgi:hypothetical protein